MNAIGELLGRWIYAPLGLTLFCYPSRKIWASIPDGGDTQFYGFPLLWNSDGISSSLTKDIYLVPLCVDLLFYALTTWFVVFVWRKQSFFRNKFVDWSLGAGVWALGVLYLTQVMFLILLMEKFYYLWYEVGESIERAALSMSF